MHKKIFSFSAVSIICSAISFFFLPLITSVLTLDGFADYSFYYSFSGMLTGVFSFGTYALYSIEFANPNKSSHNETWSLLLNLNFIFLIVSSFIFLIYIIFSDASYLLLVIPLFVISRVVFAFVSHYFRVNNMIFLFAKYNALGFGLMFLIPFIIASSIKLTGLEFIFIMAISICLVSILGAKYLVLSRDFKYKCCFPLNNPNLGYCLYSALHSLIASLITMSDRFVLKHFLVPDDFGVYSLGALLVGALSMVFSVVNQNISPGFYKELFEVKDFKIVFIKYFKYYLLSILLIFSVFQLSIDLIVNTLFDERYVGAIEIARKLSLGVLFQGCYFFASSLLIFQKKSKELFQLSFAYGILGVIGAITLFKLYGVDGVIFSFVFTWLLFMVSTFYRAKKNIYDYIKNV